MVPSDWCLFCPHRERFHYAVAGGCNTSSGMMWCKCAGVFQRPPPRRVGRVEGLVLYGLISLFVGILALSFVIAVTISLQWGGTRSFSDSVRASAPGSPTVAVPHVYPLVPPLDEPTSVRQQRELERLQQVQREQQRQIDEFRQQQQRLGGPSTYPGSGPAHVPPLR